MAESLKQNPIVSVIIPCYNAEKYGESAVRSIMSQTYKNLEIIVTDDCSTDGTFAILEKLASEDSRIRLYKNEKNLKIVKTLNNMILLAKGKYIARMDADDISLPERIEKQVKFLEENPDIAFCGTNAVIIDENGRKIGKSCHPLTCKEIRFFLQFYSTFFHPAIMIRSGVYKENLYDEDFLYAEDYELWARMIFSENLQGANLKEKLLEYRVFKEQTSAIHQEKQADAAARIFDKYRIVSEENVEFHKNLFFIHKSTRVGTVQYAKKIFKALFGKNFKNSFISAKKIMSFIYTHYPKRIFLWFALQPEGIFVLLVQMLKKIKR